MKIWVLTEEYNEYDQYGEYFLEVFTNIPHLNYLKQTYNMSTEEAKHVQKGGGRRKDTEQHWFHLRHVDVYEC